MKKLRQKENMNLGIVVFSQILHGVIQICKGPLSNYLNCIKTVNVIAKNIYNITLDYLF